MPPRKQRGKAINFGEGKSEIINKPSSPILAIPTPEHCSFTKKARLASALKDLIGTYDSTPTDTSSNFMNSTVSSDGDTGTEMVRFKSSTNLANRGQLMKEKLGEGKGAFKQKLTAWNAKDKEDNVTETSSTFVRQKQEIESLRSIPENCENVSPPVSGFGFLTTINNRALNKLMKVPTSPNQSYCLELQTEISPFELSSNSKNSWTSGESNSNFNDELISDSGQSGSDSDEFEKEFDFEYVNENEFEMGHILDTDDEQSVETGKVIQTECTQASESDSTGKTIKATTEQETARVSKQEQKTRPKRTNVNSYINPAYLNPEYKLKADRRRNSNLKKEMITKCTYCEKEIGCTSKRIAHETAVHKKERFECTLCPKSFTYLQSLKAHVRSIHLKEKRVKCKICSKQFYSVFDIKLHAMSHFSDLKHKCAECERTYVTKYGLKEHIRIIHQNQVLNCSVCGKHYYHRARLSQHIREFHPNSTKKAKLGMKAEES